MMALLNQWRQYSGLSLLLLSLATIAVKSDSSSSSRIMGTPRVLFEFMPTGDIDDTQCNIEDLERANDSQLHAIFQELQQTNFFRHFVVDLDHNCPLKDWASTSSSSKHGDHHDPDDNGAEPDEDEFECDGGSIGNELDEEAEPLCTVQGGDDAFGDPFGAPSQAGPGSDPFASSVLQSLSEQGFSSNDERNTFDWDTQTDMIVADEEESPCDDDDPNLPDNFWVDMCSNIQEGDGTKLVNLALNPERNTGYNGTHIWKAIYEENCMTTSDSCLEERVLYRLLSGLHTSTTLSIAKNYYPPSKRKNRTDWEANPQFFMDKFHHHPEHIRNMHFSYVVLLRAIKKASGYLYNYDIQSGNTLDDEASEVLLKRLLDTSILRSCSSVFEAFDESVMFQQHSDFSLQQNFKGVFHNISSILDCVQCQQCKLHGKMGMLGYGTALKILFMSTESLNLERNEVVALFNTAARLSESMVEVRELTTMFYDLENARKVNDIKAVPLPSPVPSPTVVSGSPVESLDILDTTIGIIAALGRENMIHMEREKELVDLALSRHPELLILGKHYGSDLQKFLAMSESIGMLSGKPPNPDAVIVGSGLAGLAAALNVLDRGGSVVIVEKEHLLGGNSNKASSGINGCCPNGETFGDSLESFKNDTVKSAGEAADLELIQTLVERSEQAITFLKERANVDLSLFAQLGGHSHKRTHRPSNGMAGAEIIYHMQKAVRSFEASGMATIKIDTRVTELMTEDGMVVGVRTESTIDGSTEDVYGDTTILATGGFASDRSNGSFLDQNRPELMSFPATAGGFSTGDGISLATSLNAATRDMDKIQIHPTGWVDPTDPMNPTKILAAELMRGVGGILLKDGKRFCNELGTRAYVTDKMLQSDPEYAASGKWNRASDVPTFHLVLSSSAAEDGKRHVDLYTHKGLLTRVEGLDGLSKHMGVDKSLLESELRSYQKSAEKGQDEYGKTSFRGVPMKDLSKETFYVGTTTPVLHYCMGGLKIDPEGSVLKEDGSVIPGLLAAGEVTGGVHGNNRLGGNSLLECTVFGTIVGQRVPVKEKLASTTKSSQVKEVEVERELPEITLGELAQHDTEEDLWVALHGVVYDFTEFAHEHPAGFQSIMDLAGTDGTVAYSAVHNLGMLDDFEPEKRAILKAD